LTVGQFDFGKMPLFRKFIDVYGIFSSVLASFAVCCSPIQRLLLARTIGM
jgi:hypothetical protein